MVKFKIVMEKDEDGNFVVTVPALPGCITQGKDEKEALKNAKEAIELHISALAKDGIPINENRIVKEIAVKI